MQVGHDTSAGGWNRRPLRPRDTGRSRRWASVLAAFLIGGAPEGRVSLARAPSVRVGGFQITQEASGLPHPTQIVFGRNGRLYLAAQDGVVLAFDYGINGIENGPNQVASDVGSTLLGINFDSVGFLYASSNDGEDDSGFLARLSDTDGDGVFELQERFVTNLPNAEHQNNQIAINGQILYVGMGSRTDDGEQDNVRPVPAATLLRVELDLVDFASSDNLPGIFAYGLRNPFGIAIGPQGCVWVGDNGRDTPLLPDELHVIIPWAHHGFPDELTPKSAVAPVLTLGLGTSANGLDFYPVGGPWGPKYANNIFIARFDFELDDPTGVGMDVVRIVLDEPEPGQLSADAVVFAQGFLHPLDVEVDPFGNLLVMEYGSRQPGMADARIYRIAPAAPGDSNGDGHVDLFDVAAIQNCFGDTQLTSTCAILDFNRDSVVDLSDFEMFQRSLTGP